MENCDNNRLYLYGTLISLATFALEALVGRAYKKHEVPSASVFGLIVIFFFMLGAVVVTKLNLIAKGKENGN